MQTVKVRVRKPTRVFTFLSRDVAMRREDACIVRTDRGLEYGVCVLSPEECPPELEERYKMSVVRKSTAEDEKTLLQLQADEQRAKGFCAQRIRARNLPMKLADVEYTFDKHKVVFYFTAAERVDFRELVRDLAQEFRTRIELRHIQVRDEAKLLGGIGMCGRSLCCATWLREFRPISMKMAKRQNLSLNPAKISGQCGRLLCCLSYEDQSYSPRRKAQAEPQSVDFVESAPEMQGSDPDLDVIGVREAGVLVDDLGGGMANGFDAPRAPRFAERREEALEPAPADTEAEEGDDEIDEAPEGAPGHDASPPAPGDAAGQRKRRRRRRGKKRGGPGKP